MKSKLLPRSYVGTDGPWLVIEAPDNPTIRLDARMLYAITGNRPVFASGPHLYVGTMDMFRISEIHTYALHGANLPVSGGILLQAALAMLVVPAGARLPDHEVERILAEHEGREPESVPY